MQRHGFYSRMWKSVRGRLGLPFLLMCALTAPAPALDIEVVNTAYPDRSMRLFWKDVSFGTYQEVPESSGSFRIALPQDEDNYYRQIFLKLTYKMESADLSQEFVIRVPGDLERDIGIAAYLPTKFWYDELDQLESAIFQTRHVERFLAGMLLLQNMEENDESGGTLRRAANLAHSGAYNAAIAEPFIFLYTDDVVNQLGSVLSASDFEVVKREQANAESMIISDISRIVTKAENQNCSEALSMLSFFLNLAIREPDLFSLRRVPDSYLKDVQDAAHLHCPRVPIPRPNLAAAAQYPQR